MKLMHRAKVIGIIKNVTPEEMGLAGNIELRPEAEPFKPFFDFLVDEEKNQGEPPFSNDIVEGWSIEDEHGVDRPIFAPAIDNNYSTIEWRW